MSADAKLDRQGWIIFGGTLVMLILFAASAVTLPMTNVMYCTVGLETCMTHNRRQPWHVVAGPCPMHQSLRFIRSVVFVAVSRCHSIRISNVWTPLRVCPAICAK
jgi:hypothetical protein